LRWSSARLRIFASAPQFMFDNRYRIVAKGLVSIDVFHDVTLTPSS
jgi:hypothetical protein